MTLKILNSSTNKIINTSNVRPDSNKEPPNLRANPVTFPEAIASLQREKSEDKDDASETSQNEEDPDSETSIKDSSSPSSSSKHMPVIDPDDFVGRTFLLKKEGGQCLRDRVVKSLDYFEGNLARD